MAREPAQVLCVDMRYRKKDTSYEDELSSAYQVSVVGDIRYLDEAITAQQPSVIVFDFDIPDQHGLELVKATKEKNISIPVIMLTTDSSAELAVWALRCRVWDYFIKPFDSDEVIQSIGNFLRNKQRTDLSTRANIHPSPDVPKGIWLERNDLHKMSTALAASYVKENFNKKISLDSVAELCGMSRSHFSRTFRQQHGITFQEYIVKQRMERAGELLKNTGRSVTEVAMAVGYTDLSNFTRTFKKYIGVGPTYFRNH